MEQDSATIADNLINTPDGHADGKARSLPSKALDDVDDHGNEEQGDEDAARSLGRLVL